MANQLGYLSPRRFRSLGFLATVFASLAVWFKVVDPYHRHYFDRGAVAVMDCAFRALFIPVLMWLICAPGNWIARGFFAPEQRRSFGGAERVIVAFAFGCCAWHLVMLALGFAGLYYAWVMIAICAAVLFFSAGDAAALASLAIEAFSAKRHSPAPTTVAASVSLALVCAWLLVTKGLYPTGGGDYYTHYFPYYVAVLENHGLAPNDVWYHYYYSKGDSLFFLGMLLTDPTANSLVTCCFVGTAAAAIWSMTVRIAPGTLWPACAALLYLMFYAVNMNRWGGGEWQKSHEVVAALVTLFAWALVVFDRSKAPVQIAVAGACAVTICIVNQPMGVLVSVFAGVPALASVVGRRWHEGIRWAVAGAAGFTAVLALLAISFLVTGLATDQAYDLMLRLADFRKLDAWGVVPQIVALAWLHDNLAALAPPLGNQAFIELFRFMRLELLWPWLIAPVIAVALVSAERMLRKTQERPAIGAILSSPPIIAARQIGMFVAFFAAVSLLAGREQNISFSRLSSFFVPLLAIFSTACAGTISALADRGRLNRTIGLLLPVAALCATVAVWQSGHPWLRNVAEASVNGFRLVTGKDSFAAAYSKAPYIAEGSGFAFGGINPGTLAAARQVPLGTRIWSTNLDAYCMVPDCRIESVISYKMSGRLDEIVSASPERAKLLLHQEGLDYFLFTDQARLLDLLPYGPLFDPNNIGRYLGIKWTDGNNYLLTWAAPGVLPLGREFLDTYIRHRNEKESPYFLFRDLARNLPAASERLRAPGGTSEAAFAWRHEELDQGGIAVTVATYGENCRSFVPPSPNVNMFRQGNATVFLKRACRGKTTCSFAIDAGEIGDPVNGCGKDFKVVYQCQGLAEPQSRYVASEAHGKTVILDCPAH